MTKINFKELFKLTGIPVFFASMCCLAPLVLFLFGLTTLSFAASLSDLLYGSYKWYFRGFGLILLTITLIVYFRRNKICTLDQVKRNRNKVINIILMSLIFAILLYIFWLYVVVHYAGVWAGVWS